MFETENIKKELEDISTVLKHGLSGNLYNVPEDYFEKNTLNILEKISTSQMEVPQGYFNSLAANVLIKVKEDQGLSLQEELNSISPVLLNLDTKINYSIPSDYFEGLASQINTKVKPARVVKMKPFYRYAVAAVATGLMGVGIFTNMYKSKENNVLNSDVYKTAYQILDNKSFEDVLASIPADAATAYLTSYGQNVNSALAALSAEDYNIESAEDFFINESELDLFLKNNGIKSNN